MVIDNLVTPLGGGVAYKNYYASEGGKEYIGIIEDGTYQDNRKFKIVEFVSQGFKRKGSKDILKINSFLKLKFYNWSLKNFFEGVPYITSSGSDSYGSYTKYELSPNYSSSYLINDITFLGSKYGGSPIEIVLLNALNIGGLEIKFDNRIYLEVTYVGFCEFGSDTPPVNIIE